MSRGLLWLRFKAPRRLRSGQTHRDSWLVALRC
jgi:hypothetical protein